MKDCFVLHRCKFCVMFRTLHFKRTFLNSSPSLTRRHAVHLLNISQVCEEMKLRFAQACGVM